MNVCTCISAAVTHMSGRCLEKQLRITQASPRGKFLSKIVNVNFI